MTKSRWSTMERFPSNCEPWNAALFLKYDLCRSEDYLTSGCDAARTFPKAARPSLSDIVDIDTPGPGEYIVQETQIRSTICPAVPFTKSDRFGGPQYLPGIDSPGPAHYAPFTKPMPIGKRQQKRHRPKTAPAARIRMDAAERRRLGLPPSAVDRMVSAGKLRFHHNIKPLRESLLRRPRRVSGMGRSASAHIISHTQVVSTRPVLQSHRSHSASASALPSTQVTNTEKTKEAELTIDEVLSLVVKVRSALDARHLRLRSFLQTVSRGEIDFSPSALRVGLAHLGLRVSNHEMRVLCEIGDAAISNTGKPPPKITIVSMMGGFKSLLRRLPRNESRICDIMSLPPGVTSAEPESDCVLSLAARFVRETKLLPRELLAELASHSINGGGKEERSIGAAARGNSPPLIDVRALRWALKGVGAHNVTNNEAALLIAAARIVAKRTAMPCPRAPEKAPVDAVGWIFLRTRRYFHHHTSYQSEDAQTSIQRARSSSAGYAARRQRARRAQSIEREREAASATLIQTRVRGMHGRRAVEQRRRENKETISAIKIQSAVRQRQGHEAISVRRRRSSATIKIQAFHRGQIGRQRASWAAQRKKSASRIQALSRGRSGRANTRCIKAKREAQKYHESAARIQSVTRGRSTRRRVQRQRLETNSAVRIQAVQRGRIDRSAVARQRAELISKGQYTELSTPSEEQKAKEHAENNEKNPDLIVSDAGYELANQRYEYCMRTKRYEKRAAGGRILVLQYDPTLTVWELKEEYGQKVRMLYAASCDTSLQPPITGWAVGTYGIDPAPVVCEAVAVKPASLEEWVRRESLTDKSSPKRGTLQHNLILLARERVVNTEWAFKQSKELTAHVISTTDVLPARPQSADSVRRDTVNMEYLTLVNGPRELKHLFDIAAKKNDGDASPRQEVRSQQWKRLRNSVQMRPSSAPRTRPSQGEVFVTARRRPSTADRTRDKPRRATVHSEYLALINSEDELHKLVEIGFGGMADETESKNIGKTWETLRTPLKPRPSTWLELAKNDDIEQLQRVARPRSAPEKRRAQSYLDLNDEVNASSARPPRFAKSVIVW